MNQLSLKIYGMDCAEEITLIKSALKSTLNNHQGKRLHFDILNGKLVIDRKVDDPSDEEIIKAIERTGMKAILWKEYVKKSSEKKGFWSQHGHAMMVIISAAALLIGFFFHASQDGIKEAFIGSEAGRHYFPTISIFFYLIAILTGGWFAFPKAFYSAKRVSPDINLLMVIALIGAMVIQQWLEATAVAFLFAAASLLESWSVGRARKAIAALVGVSPKHASCKIGGKLIQKPIEKIEIGAIIVIKPGEKIPMDSTITEGSSNVNQAPITGESMPVYKKVGDNLFAGSINGNSMIKAKVVKKSQDSTLANIIRMVEEAQTRRAKSEQWVEKFARYYTPTMIFLAILIAIIPPLVFAFPWAFWFYQGLVILVIACPCALVISTPVTIVAALNTAARAGILIKGGIYLELAAHIRAIALDKTGTLTTGEPEVKSILSIDGADKNEKFLLKIAAALETHTDHPLAKAIERKAETEGLIDQLPVVQDFKIIQGKGAEGKIENQLYWLGSHRFLHEKLGESVDHVLHEKGEALEASGHSIVVIGEGRELIGLIALADTLRANAQSSIIALKRKGVRKVIMLTGDNKGTAETIARSCGVDQFKAELLPEEKLKEIKKLVETYQQTAMVGDGINDAPAMAAANLGIAMGAIGSDAAIETADIALMSDDLGKLSWLMSHSRHALRVIKQNIGFALVVKVIFIGLAILGMATLWMAIAADMGASFLVIFNGLRLLKQRQ